MSDSLKAEELPVDVNGYDAKSTQTEPFISDDEIPWECNLSEEQSDADEDEPDPVSVYLKDDTEEPDAGLDPYHPAPFHVARGLRGRRAFETAKAIKELDYLKKKCGEIKSEFRERTRLIYLIEFLSLDYVISQKCYSAESQGYIDDFNLELKLFVERVAAAKKLLHAIHSSAERIEEMMAEMLLTVATDQI